MTEKAMCSKCGESKPLTLEHFHKNPNNKKNGFRRICKACRRTSELKRWHRNSEQANAKRREGSQKGPWRLCKDCRRPKPLTIKHWQAEKRKASGFRQPCKACLKKRKEKPIPLDQKPKP